MLVTVKTLNSTYLINEESKTWERVKTNGKVGPAPLRTEYGTYDDYVLGDCLLIFADPITKGADARIIRTSLVQSVEKTVVAEA